MDERNFCLNVLSHFWMDISRPSLMAQYIRFFLTDPMM